MAKQGRRSSYQREYCEQARKLCRLGATDMEIADFLAINIATLYRWKNDHPEFCEALKEAKTEADARVEASLYHRALGYSYDSEHVRVLSNGQIIRVPIREHLPPDTTACIFWLKNRKPREWRDRQELDQRIEVEDQGPSNEQIARALALLLAEARKRRLLGVINGQNGSADGHSERFGANPADDRGPEAPLSGPGSGGRETDL